MLSPDALLSGPRGRRALLELLLAKASDSGLERELNKIGFYSPAPVTELDLASMVNEVKAISLSEAVTEVDLLRAVQRSVDAAMYWQEPDGIDQASALSEVRRALHDIARQVAELPDAQWWTSGFSFESQVWLRWHDPRYGPMPRPKVLAPSSEEWRSWYPAEGEWWSAPQDVHSSCLSIGSHGATGLWWLEDSFGIGTVELIDVLVDPEVRVLEIRGTSDWAELCRRYPLDVTQSKGRDWSQVTARNGDWLMPNWARVAADYDAIHLTVLGYLEAAGLEIKVDEKFSAVLSGWNPAETYWLGDNARLGRKSTVWNAGANRKEMSWSPSNFGRRFRSS